jgi:hypothetical protein
LSTIPVKHALRLKRRQGENRDRDTKLENKAVFAKKEALRLSKAFFTQKFFEAWILARRKLLVN